MAASIWFAFASSQTVLADLPFPVLNFVYPPGAKAGATVDVTVPYADLEDLDRLVFSHPGIQATAKSTPATEFEPAKLVGGSFSVQVAADVPPGIYEARTVNRWGISNPRAFVVSNRDEINEPGGNNQRDKAIDLPVGNVVNGRADGSNRDFYKLNLKGGQRTFIECWAQRIDSRMDPALTLYDSLGREVARDHDPARKEGLIDFVPPADGTYTVSVHDFVFAGGAEHSYRLFAHNGPYVDYIFPSVGLPGSNAAYTIFGRALPGGQPAEGLTIKGRPLEKLAATIALPADEAVVRQLAVPSALPLSAVSQDSFEYRFAPGISLPIFFAKAPVVVEQEPNNASANSQVVTAPCEVAGQFYPNRDEDWFQFEAKKGDAFVIELIAERVGVYCDPMLTVQRVTKTDKGENVAVLTQLDDPGDRGGRIGSDFDTSTDDPMFRLDVPEDGTYRVMVRDQFGSTRKDPRTVYRLVIRKPQPDFRLATTPQVVQAPANPALHTLGAVTLRKGGTVNVDVRVDRIDGFTGEIEISAEGLPAGITCAGAIIGGDVIATPLIFTAAENVARWEGPVRIVGKAKVGDQDAVRVARSTYAVWGTGNRQQQAPEFRVARDFMMSVADKETDVAYVQAVPTDVLVTSKGGKIDIPIKVTRRGDFKADLTLAPIGLPNELKPQNLAIKGDQADGQLAFAATNGNAKPGTYTFILRADTKVKHARNPDAQNVVQQSQAAVDAKIKELTEGLTKATQGKDAAMKAAQEAAAAVTQAQQAKTAAEAESKLASEAAKKAAEAAAAAKQQADSNQGNQDLANAAAAAEKARVDAEAKNTAATEKLTAANKLLTDNQAKAKAADEAKVAAEKAMADADAKLKAAQQAKTAIDKRLDEVKKQNAPKDLDSAFISTPIKVRVVDTPIQLNVTNPPAPVVQGQKIELPVAITRLYGFDNQVEITIEAPGNSGLQVNKVTLPKDQAAGKFEITAAPNAPAGAQTVTVRAKSQFNNVNVETVGKVTIQVAAK